MRLVKFYVADNITNLMKQRREFESRFIDYSTVESFSTFDLESGKWVAFCKYDDENEEDTTNERTC